MTKAVVKSTDTLPATRDEVFRRANEIKRQRYAHDGGYDPEASLAALDAILPEAEIVLKQLHGLDKPATAKDIAKHLLLLVNSFPNAGSADRTIYSRMLCEDVAADQPSEGDVETACREIRQTSRFLPTISEVLEAIQQAKGRRLRIAVQISDLLESRAWLLQEVQEKRERQERYLAQRTHYEDTVPPDGW